MDSTTTEIDLSKWGLTPREQAVVHLLVQGKTSKVAAREMGISHLTVRKHRENILRKLAITDTTYLAILMHDQDSAVSGVWGV